MARIGIDVRLWGVRHAGIGRYTEELVKNLQAIDKKNKYVLFCRREDLEKIPGAPQWDKIIADVPHYSVREQIELPGIFSKHKLNLLHVPHFNIPILYRGKFIVTIHDILWHEFRGTDITTLPPPLYFIKHFGYRLVMRNAVRRAERIITPTNTIKNKLVEKFSIPLDKIVVTHEGVSPHFDISIYRNRKRFVSSILKRYEIEKPYILYVGSLYPHKNINQLVLAIRQLNNIYHLSRPLRLVVVSSRNVFLDRLRNFVIQNRVEDVVRFVGFVPDEDLLALYNNAEAFVFPTHSEGFGLPGLEAMSAGTPVVCSDIPVLHEVYDGAALYFNPRDPNDIAEKIKLILSNKKLRAQLINKGRRQVKKYSWRKMAEETLVVYAKALEV